MISSKYDWQFATNFTDEKFLKKEKIFGITKIEPVNFLQIFVLALSINAC